MKTFEEMIRGSYDFEEGAYDNDPKWRVLERLYFENVLMENNYKKEGIPKIIHQIWLGGELPSKYKQWTESWQRLNPDWDYVLWDDYLADDFRWCRMSSKQQSIYQSILNNGQKSDYLRYHILNDIGGVYVDTDFECIKPFNDLSYLDFFTGVGYPRHPELYIGLIASYPNHPILQNIVNSMTEVKQGWWKEIFDTTGSYFFTRKFFETVGVFMDGVVAFPIDYFYPFPNQVGHESRNGKDYINEYSYAVHHWEVSWAKK